MSFSKFNQFSHVANTDYKLDADLVWDIGRKGSGWQLVLKKGYVFNISVPRYLTFVVNPHNQKVLLAAAVHDKLVEDGFDIAFASAEFRRAAIARGYNSGGAWMLFSTTFGYLTTKAFVKSVIMKVLNG